MSLPEPDLAVVDEAVSPAGRLFLRPELNQVINTIIAFQSPLSLSSLKHSLSHSVLVSHPRFSSLMLTSPSGRHTWRKTSVDIDRHVVAVRGPLDVNGYVAGLCGGEAGLGREKPMWEVHLLVESNCVVFRVHHALGDGVSLMALMLAFSRSEVHVLVESNCVVFTVHHALGDGVSLMALMLAFCRKSDDPNQMPSIGKSAIRGRERARGLIFLWELVVNIWFTIVFVVRIILRALWVSDRRTTITGGAGVEKKPRGLATAKFRMEDMKMVKNSIKGATINDVLFGVISSGLSRYLDNHSPQDIREGFQITGVAMVNVRKQPGLQELSELMKGNSGTRWGNKFGMMLLPIYYHKKGNAPLIHVKRAKQMLDRKKKSLEAHFSYTIGKLIMSCFGPKLATCLSYRIFCNTTFTISNVMGPQEEITVAGNPVTYIRATNSSLPNAVTMTMMSYAGRADMQILVAKDIIPDPQVLAKCFEDALLEIKEASKGSAEV